MADRRASPLSPLPSKREIVLADLPVKDIPSTFENFVAFSLPRGFVTKRPVAAERLMAWLFFIVSL